MNKVIAVTANEDYSLDLEFNDGSVKRFDAKPYLDYEFFSELKNLNYFKQVRLAFGTVHGRIIRISVQRLCILRALTCLFPQATSRCRRNANLCIE